LTLPLLPPWPDEDDDEAEPELPPELPAEALVVPVPEAFPEAGHAESASAASGAKARRSLMGRAD
jgi:hypothetical protein